MKRVKKSVIAMSVALVMLLSLAISIVPAKEVEASYPGYNDLLYSVNGVSVYTNGFSTDENGNLMFGLYFENTNMQDNYSVVLNGMKVNGSYDAAYTASGGKYPEVYKQLTWDVPAQNSRRDGVYIKNDSLSNLGVDVIDSIELTFTTYDFFQNKKYVEIPIHNQKITKSQYKGNGVYHIDGQNKNVLFGLVLDDYNYERMLPIYTIDGSNTMYRLYNGSSGEHFYTSNYSEATYLTGIGWSYEGAAWFAPANGDEVYRLYNPYSAEHHYTKDVGEKDYLAGSGWNYEGVGWKTSNSGIPVYRLFNPNNPGPAAHHYTTDENERNVLISSGWNDEGIGWYGV